MIRTEQVFENKEFGKVRTATKDNEVWFIACDVAFALGYRNPSKAIQDHVDEEDKGVTFYYTLGGKQKLTTINESGLYALILSSKLPNAKKFKRWVTNEVLPAIRETGSYKKPMSAIEQLQLQQTAILEVSDRVDKLENDMPLLGVDMDRVVKAVNKVAVNALGTKESKAYKDKSLRGKVYHDIYFEIGRQFGVTTYKALKRKELDKVLYFIQKCYEVPHVLKIEILEKNK